MSNKVEREMTPSEKEAFERGVAMKVSGTGDLKSNPELAGSDEAKAWENGFKQSAAKAEK